ncbi:MAG: GvpL/GvpF family gas vesicle protein [Phycisphaerae bacterium]
MTVQTGTSTGKYIYAIMAEGGLPEGFAAEGIDGGAVYAISDGCLAAVISDVPNRSIRPERRYMAAHHKVQRRLMESGGMLPMAFGIIGDGDEGIRRVLAVNRSALTSQLRRVAGKVEMSLHVNWKVPNIFEYFVRTHPALRQYRDRLFGGGGEPSEEAKIELGRLFDRTRSADRSAHSDLVTGILDPVCFEIEVNPPRSEDEVMNLACLVGSEEQQRFEERVFEAAKHFDDNYSFDYGGPWPPYSFVDLSLEL